MNLYLITQDVATGYDTFDSAVVAAPDEEVARRLHPNGGTLDGGRNFTWADTPGQVVAQLIGTAVGLGDEPHVVCASFNAG